MSHRDFAAHPVLGSVKAGTDDLFTSVTAWSTFVITTVIALAVVWRFRRKFDVQTGLALGVAVFGGLWMIVIAFNLGVHVGSDDCSETNPSLTTANTVRPPITQPVTAAEPVRRASKEQQ